MSLLPAAAQSATPGAKISLYKLDLGNSGGSVVYFCSSSQADAGLHFNSQYYAPMDIEASGFEVSSSGAMPQPKIRLANTNGVMQNLVNTYGDLVGCKLTRLRTFGQFLDGAAEADPTAFYGPDVYNIERKSIENPIFIEWELSGSIDQQGAMIPGRVIIRDVCLWRYRFWTGTAFDYSKVQCPYTGSATFDQSGAVVTPSLDQCGRRISDCKLRFGRGNPLPFGGFPGVERYSPS